jgi:hypothetical protein
MQWRLGVGIRRSVDIAECTTGVMSSDKMSYNVIVPKCIVMELKEKNPFRVGVKIVSPDFIQKLSLFPIYYNV